MRIYKVQVQCDQQQINKDMRKYEEQVECDQLEIQEHMQQFMRIFTQSQPNSQLPPFTPPNHDATGP